MPSSADEPRVSAVVVTGRGQHGLIATVMSATVAQTRPPDELVILDYANPSALSVPQIAECLALVANTVPATLMRRHDPRSWGDVRIDTVQAARHDLIWILEDDLFVTANALGVLVEEVVHSGLPARPASMERPPFYQELVEHKEGMLVNYEGGETREALLHATLLPRAVAQEMVEHWLGLEVFSDVVVGRVTAVRVIGSAGVWHCQNVTDKGGRAIRLLKRLLLQEQEERKG